MPKILVIGGSDGSCGAGVFADHETLISLGSKAKFIVTAVTSQNDEVFLETHDVPSSTLESQFEAISFKDFDAIKIGMLPSVEAVQIVSRYLSDVSQKIVMDPVLRSSSGGSLSTHETISAMEELLFPKVDLLTPNLLEAFALLNLDGDQEIQIETIASRCLEFGSEAVLLKGGHLKGAICKDILVEKVKAPIIFKRNKIVGGTSVRGTGCRLASAIAHFLAEGRELEEAVNAGIEILQRYIRTTLNN
ncbi:MAG: hydroxymethylpyrimidine/phosphomethylpyrimidine kinase [Opitutae bacterium]|nr:hydroxymethylpyrimidine/phosphomethylpyrimidine kinase [Opitutae bacterium]HAD22035.1 hydroxymethylpyrimidine/phosphomethylpyrimidine kinase [Opitutae bacterium]